MRPRIALCVTAVVLCGLAAPRAHSRAGDRRITVVFRYDDVSSRSDTALELRLLEAFRQYGMACTFGVIPVRASEGGATVQDLIPLSAEKAAILTGAIREGTLDVAQHGYAHQPIRQGAGAVGDTEFSGLAYQEQERLIAAGKRLLEEQLGLPIMAFVPPWNSYDQETVRAVEHLGFTTISAAPSGIAPASSRLAFLPSTTSLVSLREAVKAARTVHDGRALIVALFHEYDFREANPVMGRTTYEEFAELLGWVAAQPDLTVRTLGDAARQDGDLGPARLRSAQALARRVHHPLMPSWLQDQAVAWGRVYPSTRTLRRLRVMGWLLADALYAGTLLFAAIGAFFGWRRLWLRSRPLGRAAKAGWLLLLGACAAYALRDLTLHVPSALVLSGLLGGCVGIWIAARLPSARSLP